MGKGAQKQTLSVDLTIIHPTRLELLRLKRRKMLAEGIVDILKKDYDALMIALFELVRNMPSLRQQMREKLAKAYGLFIEAQMVTGQGKIEEVSLVCEPVDFSLEVSTRRGVLGLTLPFMQLTEQATAMSHLRFSLLDTPAQLDESVHEVKVALSNIVKLAETQAAMQEILDVMAVKRRQINRIEYKVLPQIDAAIRYVELILEETERQDAIRVRVLQRKRKERVQKALGTPA